MTTMVGTILLLLALLLATTTLAFTVQTVAVRTTSTIQAARKTLPYVPHLGTLHATVHDDETTTTAATAATAATAITTTTTTTSPTTTSSSVVLVGDDAAYFSFKEQKLSEWISFTIATSTVLALVAYVWVLPIGPHGGDVLVQQIQSLTGTVDPAITVFAMLSTFAVAHSGLAALRTYAEPVVGPRAWRVVFAVVSLPLALSCVSYFINHAHEGVQLWHVPQDNVTLHAMLWMMNFLSFMFLYPSTFNLLEIAAIQPPQLHLWETGIIRISRHPQAVGQLLWCLAHTLWLGTSTAVAASTALLLHHAFAVYHGDRRLATRHGEAFDYIQEKTSVIPFQAIVEGRQVLPSDYYKEFLRGPYFIVVAGTIGAYLAHPWLQAGAAALHW